MFDDDPNKKFWNLQRWVEQSWNKLQNSVRFVTINTSDDSHSVQVHQTSGFSKIKETRNNVKRIQQHGLSTMPTIGSKAITLTGVAGDQTNAVILGDFDSRYRPTGLKQGETQMFLVDGASAKDGSGGKTRTIINGLTGWITSIFGKTINIGDSNATTIIITGTNITIKGAIKLDGAVEITKDLTVDGKITDKGDLSIGGTETGGGTAI